jgi:hypothetical protein
LNPRPGDNADGLKISWGGTGKYLPIHAPQTGTGQYAPVRKFTARGTGPYAPVRNFTARGTGQYTPI